MKPADLERIRAEAGASAVFSLQHDECLSYWDIDYGLMQEAGSRLGLRMERSPIRDFDLDDMRRRLPAAVSLLSELLEAGHRVYVHCTAGMGRSPLVVLGYLSLVEGKSADCAMNMILSGRPEAMPSFEALEGCREDLTERHWGEIERRAHELYRLGKNDDAHADWEEAKSETLRKVLTEKRGP
jgi:hypothetical protein